MRGEICNWPDRTHSGKFRKQIIAYRLSSRTYGGKRQNVGQCWRWSLRLGWAPNKFESRGQSPL